MEIVLVYDATHDNIGHLPHGQAAGYTTGTGPHIRWTDADWAAHPGAVRIDQDPAASDPTADVLDVESGAAAASVVARWAKLALVSYRNATRPGQRSPAIYCSRATVTAVVNALVTGGVKSGVGLWIADWNNNVTAAQAEVEAASGPFPVIGRQFKNAGPYDISVFSAAWLADVSGAAPAAPPPPPGQWDDPKVWTWKDACVSGTGLDGGFHIFHLEGGQWRRLQ